MAALRRRWPRGMDPAPGCDALHLVASDGLQHVRQAAIEIESEAEDFGALEKDAMPPLVSSVRGNDPIR